MFSFCLIFMFLYGMDCFLLHIGICRYWLAKADSATPLVLWDAFKALTKGEYISHIAVSRRASAQSLKRLEEEIRQKEAAYVANSY